MMIVPGNESGRWPSVNESVSESVAGSVSQDGPDVVDVAFGDDPDDDVGAVDVWVVDDGVVGAVVVGAVVVGAVVVGAVVVGAVVVGAVVVGDFARIVTASDGSLESELPEAFVATVVNVYAVPAVSPSIVQEPLEPVIVQVLPPGDAVTVYEVGARPEAGAATVIVALSSPATTVGLAGVFGVSLGSAAFAIARSVNETVSFPLVLCSALFASELSTAGAAYDTVTVSPA
jgi:hypothetical protein